jgi:hypothetical protein
LAEAGAAESLREAERAFAQALAVGRSQGAGLLVLRAAISLGRLWVRLGRGKEARRFVNSAIRESDDQIASPDAMEANAVLGANMR